MVVKIEVAKLLASPYNCWRISKADPATVARYAALQTPAPPLFLFEDGDLVEGAHRLAAAVAAGRTHVAAEFKYPVSEKHQDMTWRSWPR